MPKAYNQPPYNDDYDRSKNYVQQLAVPGRALQAREYTQLGTMVLDHVGRVGDSLYSDGHIIAGCDLVVRGNEVILSEGRIWLEGLVRIVNGANLTISGVGTEIIGAKIIRSVVTETDDSTLRDPAQGYENYGLEGAHRVKEEVEFTVNDDEASVIYRLVDGILVNETVDNESALNEVLARRTFDENGNYKVEGLELLDRAESDEKQVMVSLSAGKAYIRGYEVTKSYNTTVKLNKSFATRHVLNEPKIYALGTDSYKFNNTPVSSVTQVTAVVEATEQMTRGSIAGGTDYLKNYPVVSIQRVWNSEKEFEQGVDYQLTNDGVDWSLAGTDPAIGSTYYVTYWYNRSMEPEVDFKVSGADENSIDTITFINDEHKPVEGSSFLLDYDFFLCRVDVVLVDKDGNVKILEGKPEIERLLRVPQNGDNSLLPIGYVVIAANSSHVELHNYNTTRMSQGDLYNMSRRLDDLEYNQAVTDLDEEAMEGESATDLKGIFTDGFIGATKADLSHPDYNCSIVVDGEFCTLPMEQGVVTVNPNLSVIDTIVGQKGRVIMCPFREEVAIEQSHATTPFLVNPYAVYNPMSVVNLNPSVDNWIDTEVSVINKTQTKTTRVVRGGYFKAYTETLSRETSSTERVVSSDIIEYMRQTNVVVSGSNFTPYEDNIKCLFDGKEVNLKPRGTTEAGTVAGTIKVDGSGKFDAYFTVPANTPCGKVSVELVGATSNGTAVYEAEGSRQIIERTVLTTVQERRVVDPVAQTFQFDKDTVITKVGLYFAAKDPSKAVIVQIRSVENGYPSSEILAQVTVPAFQVLVSSGAQAETVVELNQPVYCVEGTQYAICIKSDSNAYQMWTAQLGEKDVGSGAYVTSQPYVEGVMFSSSNALAWTAHQTHDLKFRIYKAEYTSDAEVIYDNATGLSVIAVVLAASTIDYKNAGIEWFYRTSNNGSWIPIDAFEDRELGSQESQLQIKCTLKRLDGVSPMVAGDCVNLVGISYLGQGAYVSREVTTDDAYNNIRVILEANTQKPSHSACNFEVYIQAADDTTNQGWRHLTSPSITPVSEEYDQFEYVLDGLDATRYRIKIEMTSSNPVLQPRIRRLMSILKY